MNMSYRLVCKISFSPIILKTNIHFRVLIRRSLLWKVYIEVVKMFD